MITAIEIPSLFFAWLPNISFLEDEVFQVTFDFNFFLCRSNVENENHHRSRRPPDPQNGPRLETQVRILFFKTRTITISNIQSFSDIYTRLRVINSVF